MDEISRTREDDWFRNNEAQLLEAARLARQKREKERAALEAAEQRARLKDLHYMHCPKCGHDMKENDISGIKVDTCTFCEGIYLDAGELEQLFLKKTDAQRGLLRRLLSF
ncbi:MAG: zf-TFIIB domain-containing protein [Vicinamibacteria bacterium]|jgi:hypothetical protein|nr:zf-TFIIB domain-containing protein [Vicinamibacteria bacterium]